jgi:hypothetical protein
MDSVFISKDYIEKLLKNFDKKYPCYSYLRYKNHIINLKKKVTWNPILVKNYYY